MKTTLFRVECNNGSKYFDKGIEAFDYFNKQKARKHEVEIWLITYERSKKIFLAEQELLSFYSPKKV